MALLARARAKDPDAGFVPDALACSSPRLAEIHERGIKIVTNAGALNPAACAAAFAEAAEEAGVPLRIAAVEGDDLLGQLPHLRADGAADMFTGEPLPADPMTMNAYLGARPIADALAAGADIVVTGRCVDSSVVLGPLLHEFGWSDEDYDLLSAGTLAGHIVECGPQCTGGNFTDWDTVPGWDNMGFPLIECYPDGTAVVTKPREHRRPGHAGHDRRADRLRDRRPGRLRDARRGLRLAPRHAGAGRPEPGPRLGCPRQPPARHLQGRPPPTPTATA